MAEFIAYIDESGDEGIGRGSQWFVLAAAIVELGKANSQLGQKLEEIKKQRIALKKDVMHWSELSHPRKQAVSQELASQPFTICAVAVDTSHPRMQGTTLLGGRLYFYAFRWLVERITWFVADNSENGQIRLRPENKGGISYGDLESYLQSVQGLPDCQIRPGCILDVKPRTKQQLPLLQIADTVAGAITGGLERQYGVVEPSYILAMRNLLYKRKDKLWGYGIKFMPHEASAIPVQLIPTYQWLSEL